MSVPICEACGKPIPDGASTCPHCGAEQREPIRLTKIPETIEELRAFCDAHHMPLEKMRFFIGEDYRGARAFGIYREPDGSCVVYKNKSDGSRAVRYQGPDEKYAVRELYEKLKSETELRRGSSQPSRPTRSTSSSSQPQSSDKPTLWRRVAPVLYRRRKLILIVTAVSLVTLWVNRIPNEGYYRYQGERYYYDLHGSDWYYYDEVTNGWTPADDVPSGLERHYGDYFEGEYYSSDYGASDFMFSSYYESSHTYDSGSSYDSDDDWDDYDWDDYDWDDYDDDWDDWDDYDTDWDSDW